MVVKDVRCECLNVQEWKIIKNFHVRVRRRNKVTGKYVSTVQWLLAVEDVAVQYFNIEQQNKSYKSVIYHY